MANLRSRLMTLVLLGVGLAGGVYLLNAQSEEPPEEPPTSAQLSADSSPPSTANLAKDKSSDSGPAAAKADEEGSRGPSSSTEVSHLGAGRPEDESKNDSSEDSAIRFEPLTEGATDFPNMKEVDPSESAYDPKLEAQQAFAPMEEDLLASDPLDPEAWRQALETHRLRNAGVTKRAQFLRESGHPELAEDLIVEWGRVYGTWQARAYGRAGPPGYKSPQR
jgi:hypothetical protein